MWYAFWAITLAFVSLAIIWYAMYRENLEESNHGKEKAIGASLKFANGKNEQKVPPKAPQKKILSTKIDALDVKKTPKKSTRPNKKS